MLNEFLVGSNGDKIVFLRPVPQRLTKEQALDLAAWIVAMTGGDIAAFKAKVDEVCR